MRPLTALGEDWEERRRLEGQLLRSVTVFESVSELEALYREFGRHLEAREPDLQVRRAEYLTTLQARLARAAQYHRTLEA